MLVQHPSPVANIFRNDWKYPYLHIQYDHQNGQLMIQNAFDTDLRGFIISLILSSLSLHSKTEYCCSLLVTSHNCWFYFYYSIFCKLTVHNLNVLLMWITCNIGSIHIYSRILPSIPKQSTHNHETCTIISLPTCILQSQNKWGSTHNLLCSCWHPWYEAQVVVLSSSTWEFHNQNRWSLTTKARSDWQ